MAHVIDALLVYYRCSVVTYTKHSKYHSRSRDIDSWCHYIRDVIAQGKVVVKHISTIFMIVDSLTKPIIRDAFLTHIKCIGLCQI